MSASNADVVRLNSEAELWEALGHALSHSEERAPFQPDFLEATWAKTHIVYEGRQFHSSLTPSAMKGIVEIQSALYRAAAQLLHDEASIRRLTDTEFRKLVGHLPRNVPFLGTSLMTA